MRYAELLTSGQQRLEACGISDAAMDSRLLVEAASGKNYTALCLARADEVDEAVIERFETALTRRLQREPVAYILGEWEFFGRSFTVNRSVLIPRPETEFLIEQLLARSSSQNLCGSILDLCTGSGVIAVTLALELSAATVYASDLCRDALAVAVTNRGRYLPGQRLSFFCGDLLEPVAEKSFSLIVANPPYLLSGELECEVEAEVRDYEPHPALDGGEDGLVLIRRIFARLPKVLAADGELFLEFGSGQGAAVRRLAAALFVESTVLCDYAGHERVLHGRGLRC